MLTGVQLAIEPLVYAIRVLSCLKQLEKKMIKATHQRKKARVSRGISSLTARPITKLPPHNNVASSNSAYGGIFMIINLP